MTEQEAIKEFQERLAIEDYKKDIPEYYAAMEMAVSSLSEIQQYRALGTVEELREARERQIPKKMKDRCPYCGTPIKRCYFNCPGCGQAID